MYNTHIFLANNINPDLIENAKRDLLKTGIHKTGRGIDQFEIVSMIMCKAQSELNIKLDIQKFSKEWIIEKV